MVEIIIPSTDSLHDAARRFIAAAGDRRVFAFYGKMGAGKTTFIKAVCQELGITDTVTSPTFAIINEYAGAGHTIHHIDCYRLKNVREFLDIGGEDYLYSGDWCFVEWPGIIQSVLPSDTVNVAIEESTDYSRRLVFL